MYSQVRTMHMPAVCKTVGYLAINHTRMTYIGALRNEHN